MDQSRYFMKNPTSEYSEWVKDLRLKYPFMHTVFIIECPLDWSRMKSGISLVAQRRGSFCDKVMQVVNKRMQGVILILQKSTRGL